MPYYSDNNGYMASRVDDRINRDTAYAYDRERSVASKVVHAVRDIAVATVTLVLGPVAGFISSVVNAVLSAIFD